MWCARAAARAGPREASVSAKRVFGSRSSAGFHGITRLGTDFSSSTTTRHSWRRARARWSAREVVTTRLAHPRARARGMYSTAERDCGPPTPGTRCPSCASVPQRHPLRAPSDPRGTRLPTTRHSPPRALRAQPAGRAATDPRDSRGPRSASTACPCRASSADPDPPRGASPSFSNSTRPSPPRDPRREPSRLGVPGVGALRSHPTNQPLKISSLHTAFLRRHGLQLQVAIREALGEAKAKERTVGIKTLVKKYLADAVEMKAETSARTDSNTRSSISSRENRSRRPPRRTQRRGSAIPPNAIGDPADGGTPPRTITTATRSVGGTAVASIVHPAPVAREDERATVKAIRSPGLSKRPRTGRRVRGARDSRRRRHRLPVQRRYAAWSGPRGGRPTPRSRRDASGLRRGLRSVAPPAEPRFQSTMAPSSDRRARADFIRRRPSRASSVSYFVRRPTRARAAERVAGLADELLDARRARRDANRASKIARRKSRPLPASTASFFEDLKREAEVERSVWTERARAATERAERGGGGVFRGATRAYRGGRCRALADDLRSNPIEKSPRRRRDRRGTRRRLPGDASARLEGALAASHVRLRAAEAPVGIAAAAGAPRVAGGGNIRRVSRFPAWTNRPRRRRRRIPNPRPSVACAQKNTRTSAFGTCSWDVNTRACAGNAPTSSGSKARTSARVPSAEKR